MRPFWVARDGRFHARFEADEAELILHLATEAAKLAGHAATTSTDAVRGVTAVAEDAPVLLRLLPDAYPDDADASAEFRRFTASGLAERKARNATIVAESLAGNRDAAADVWLDEAQASAWLRALTDMRLVIAARLGILQDGDEGDIHDDESAIQRAIYDWLAGVQDSLVVTLSAR